MTSRRSSLSNNASGCRWCKRAVYMAYGNAVCLFEQEGVCKCWSSSSLLYSPVTSTTT